MLSWTTMKQPHQQEMCDPSTGFSLLPSEKNCAGGRPKRKGECGPTTTDDLWPSSRRHRPSLRPSVRASVCPDTSTASACLPGFTSTITCLQNRLLPPRTPPVSERTHSPKRVERREGGDRPKMPASIASYLSLRQLALKSPMGDRRSYLPISDL